MRGHGKGQKSAFVRGSLSLLVVLLGFLPTDIFPYVDYPFGVTLQTFRPLLPPIDAENPGEGKISLGLSMSRMNVWSFQRNRAIIDGEESHFEGSIRYGLQNDLTLGIQIPYMQRGGGTLDSSIESFHSAIGVSQGHRDGYPKDRLNQSVEHYTDYYPYLDLDLKRALLRNFETRMYPRNQRDPPLNVDAAEEIVLNGVDLSRGRFFREKETESISQSTVNGMGNPKLFAQKDFHFPVFFERMSLGVQVKMPGKGEGQARSGIDQSVYVHFSKSWKKIESTTGFSYTTFSLREYQSHDLPPQQSFFRQSIAYRVGFDQKLLFEYAAFSGVANNLGRLSDYGHQVVMAWEYRDVWGRIHVGFAEDIINYSISPDIGFFTSIEFIPGV